MSPPWSSSGPSGPSWRKCCNSNRGSVPETVFPRTREDGFFEIKKNALTKINFSDIICTESKIIQTKGAPAAIGPYSQGISTGKLLFTSGQLPVNPADGAMPEGIAAQAEWSCKNVGAILEAAGSGFEKVVKTTCFLADIADFAAFNEVYARYFTSKPARSCVAVKDLPKGALCEIEAVAELD